MDFQKSRPQRQAKLRRWYQICRTPTPSLTPMPNPDAEPNPDDVPRIQTLTPSQNLTPIPKTPKPNVKPNPGAEPDRHNQTFSEGNIINHYPNPTLIRLDRPTKTTIPVPVDAKPDQKRRRSWRSRRTDPGRSCTNPLRSQSWTNPKLIPSVGAPSWSSR